jgi:hypothetical protein
VPADPNKPDPVLAAVEHARLKREYGAMFADLASYFYESDPMGLNFGVNPDEYEPEVGTILPRILDAESPADIAPVLIEEFERWFGPHVNIERATYDELAEGVFEIVARYRL